VTETFLQAHRAALPIKSRNCGGRIHTNRDHAWCAPKRAVDLLAAAWFLTDRFKLPRSPPVIVAATQS